MNVSYLRCVAPAAISAVVAVILYTVRGIIFRVASRRAAHTETRMDNIVVETIRVRRFREEGVEIPFPRRTVHIREEKG